MSNEIANCCGTTCDKAAVVAELKNLKNELRQRKLIHLGFTNEAQVSYVTEQKEEASIFPDYGNGCYIPVYMLDISAHRVGPDSQIYCEREQRLQEVNALQSRVKSLEGPAARLFDLNEYCQKNNVGQWGDSVVDSVFAEIERLRADNAGLSARAEALQADAHRLIAGNAKLSQQVATQGLLLRSWQTWLGASREQCDEAGHRLWGLIDAAIEGAPHLLGDIIKDAYRQGFAVSREGFNGDVEHQHLAPDGLTIDQLADRFAAKRSKV